MFCMPAPLLVICDVWKSQYEFAWFLLVVNGCVTPYHAMAAQVTSVHCTDSQPFDRAALFQFILFRFKRLSVLKTISARAVSLDGTFWAHGPWCFHLQKCCDQWKPGWVLFFRGLVEKWSSPCEIGSRESSADQPVCRRWGDKLWTLLGYSALRGTSLMGLASHGSNLQMAHLQWPVSYIIIPVNRKENEIKALYDIYLVARGTGPSPANHHLEIETPYPPTSVSK